MTRAETVREQRPVALLTGLFVGFASTCLTMGVFWLFAPLFPAMIAGIATLVPVRGGFTFAKGALIAVLGVVAFEVLFVVLMYVGLALL